MPLQQLEDAENVYSPFGWAISALKSPVKNHFGEAANWVSHVP